MSCYLTAADEKKLHMGGNFFLFSLFCFENKKFWRMKMLQILPNWNFSLKFWSRRVENRPRELSRTSIYHFDFFLIFSLSLFSAAWVGLQCEGEKNLRPAGIVNRNFNHPNSREIQEKIKIGFWFVLDLKFEYFSIFLFVCMNL